MYKVHNITEECKSSNNYQCVANLKRVAAENGIVIESSSALSNVLDDLMNVQRDEEKMVTYLEEMSRSQAPFDVNAQDVHGRTALMNAIARNDVRMVKRFLDKTRELSLHTDDTLLDEQQKSIYDFANQLVNGRGVKDTRIALQLTALKRIF